MLYVTVFVHHRISTVALFFLHATATPEIYTLSLHDALPISLAIRGQLGHDAERKAMNVPDLVEVVALGQGGSGYDEVGRSEEHTSELQSRVDLVCRLLLEKKKKEKKNRYNEDEKQH